jgi:hypothetical protein
MTALPVFQLGGADTLSARFPSDGVYSLVFMPVLRISAY